MKLATQILAKNIFEPSEKELIRGILHEIERLNKIVTDLLNFSRPKMPLPSSVDISEVIGRSLAFVWKSMKDSRIELVREIDDDIPTSFVDREQIEQVFLNLLLNALKAMPDGGTLTISVKERYKRGGSGNGGAVPGDEGHAESGGKIYGRLVEVTVRDTGCGIRKEILPNIFNPFFTTNPGGTGLGLSIVQKLMEKNHGEISIESKENSGTRVTLLFPVTEAEKTV